MGAEGGTTRINKESANMMAQSQPSQSLEDGLTVSIIAYNEVDSLASITREILDVLRTIGVPHEVFIIDDGSRDGTSELADRLAAEEEGLTTIHHEVNRGIGPAFRAGIESGTMPLVTVFAGDGQFPAVIISQFLERMKDVDMVLGYIPEIEGSRPPLLVFFSWAERLIVRTLFGEFPRYQGAMMFRRALFHDTTLTSEGRGWFIQMEVILRAMRKGAEIISLPIPLRPRAHGRSRATTVRNIISNARQIVSLWYRLVIFRK